MCGLCGVFEDGKDWADSFHHGEAFAREKEQTRLQERQNRSQWANRILAYYGLTVQDWQGSAYVLRSRTGRQAIVKNLAHMWAEAEKLARRPLDPLDPELQKHLVASTGVDRHGRA